VTLRKLKLSTKFLKGGRNGKFRKYRRKNRSWFFEELLREGPFRDIDKATTTIYNSLSRIKNSYQSIASDGDFKDAYGAFMKYYKTIRGSVLIKKFGDL